MPEVHWGSFPSNGKLCSQKMQLPIGRGLGQGEGYTVAAGNHFHLHINEESRTGCLGEGVPQETVTKGSIANLFISCPSRVSYGLHIKPRLETFLCRAKFRILGILLSTRDNMNIILSGY